MQKTRPSETFVAYQLLLPHSDVERMRTGTVSSPIRLWAMRIASASSICGGGSLMS